jgi:membrane-anchored protein YejM (alkaline phosphatase superfamily)
MGVRNPVSDYAQGVPLTAREGAGSVLVAAWDTAAIVDEDTVTAFGLEAYNSEVEILDWDYVPLADQRAALAARKGQRLEALAGMRQFTK